MRRVPLEITSLAIMNYYFWFISETTLSAFGFPIEIGAFNDEPEMAVLYCKM